MTTMRLTSGPTPLAAAACAIRRRLALPRAPVMRLVAVLVTVLALAPLGFVAWVAAASGLDTIATLVFRPRVGELVVNTALLVLIATPVTAVLGVALAWMTERTDLPARRLVAWLAIAPLTIPAFVHGYAWVSLVPGFHGLGAAVIVSVLAYLPFMYMPVAAAMRRMDPGLEDTAASLGLAPGAVFLRVVLPQLRLGLLGGGLLVGLHLLAEYGLFAMLRFDSFTTAIVDQFQSTYNGPAANMLAGVLTCLCLGLVGAEGWARGRARYARIGSGAARGAKLQALGRLRLPCFVLMLAFAAVALGVPLVTLARWLVKGGLGVWRLEAIVPAILQTCALAAVGAILTALAALPLAWLAVRHPDRLTRVLEAATYFVGALPGVVVALALVSIAVGVLPALYQTLATLLAAYVILFLPRALVGLKVSLAQVPRGLEDAAASLGRRPWAALLLVTLRLAAPGIAAGMALVALGATSELTATLLLAPNGTRTLATEFWAYSAELDYAAAAPFALLMVIFSLPMTALLHAQSRWASGR